MRVIILIILFGLATKTYSNGLIAGSAGGEIQGEVISKFQNPWAMSFIDKKKPIGDDEGRQTVDIEL